MGLIELLLPFLIFFVIPLVSGWLTLVLMKLNTLSKQNKIAFLAATVLAMLISLPLSQIFVPLGLIIVPLILFVVAWRLLKLPPAKSALIAAVFMVLAGVFQAALILGLTYGR